MSAYNLFSKSIPIDLQKDIDMVKTKGFIYWVAYLKPSQERRINIKKLLK